MAYLGKRPQDTFPAGNAVNAATIAANAVGSSEIANNAVTTLQIADSAVTGVKLAANSIAVTHIPNGLLTATQMANNIIGTDQLVNGVVTSAKIAADSVTGAKIADDAVDSEHLVDGSIDTAHLGNLQVTGAKIAANTIATGNIADNAVDGTKIAQNSILTRHIDDSQVGAAQLADDAVTAAKLASDAVVTASITDANVTTAKIADANVTTAKIADDAVALSKMAGLARGKIIVGDSSGNPVALALGSSGQVLKSDGTDLAFAADSVLTTEEVQDIAGGMFSSNTETGIAATYQDSDGTIDLVIGDNAIAASMIAENVITTRELTANGVTSAQIAQNSILARHIPSGGISADHLASTSVTAASYGSSTAIPTFTVDADGRLTAASTAAISSALTVAADSGSNDTVTVGTDTLTFEGTSNEIVTTVSNNKVNFALPDNVTIGGDLTVAGTTTTVSSTTITVADPLVALASGNNSADAVDIGLYGLYDTSGSQDLYSGLFRDASDSGKWKLFKDTQAAPTTTVNTGGTGYAVGTLVAALEGNVTGNLTGNVTGNTSGTSGSTTGNAATATTLATARTIGGVSFNGSANINLPGVNSAGNQATSGLAATATALATGRTVGMTGDVVWTSASFTGAANVTGAATIQADAVETAMIGNDQVTLAKMAGLARGKIIYGDSSSNPAALALGSNGQVLKSDGTDIAWAADAGLSTEEVQDIAGGMFSSNTETGITATYQDADGTIDLVIGANGIVSSMITDDNVTQAKIADDAVGADQLAVNSVVSASIVNGSIVSADIAANTIALSNIADNAVDGTKIASNSILTRHIDDNQITGDQIADNIVLSGTGAIRMPDGTTGQRPGSAAAGMFRYNTTEGKFEGYTDAWGEIGGGGANGFLTDIFNGSSTPATDGSRTAFTMSQTVSTENFVMVFVDGVFQAQSAYSVSGDVLTMADAPVAGRTLTVHSVSATVSGDGLNVDNFSGDGSDVTFTLSLNPTHENNTQVYIDGVYQFKNTYSVSGQVLTFSSAPPNGTAIEVMIHSQTTINNASGLAAGGISGLTQVTAAGADHFMIFDATDSALKKALVSDVLDNVVLTDEQAQDIVGAMFTSNTETGITATYQDADGTVDLVIGDNSVVSGMIAENNITAREIAANAILTQHIDDNQVTADQIAAATITTTQIAANTIATANVADNAIDGTKIASNSILTRHIDDDQITGAQLADNIAIVGTLAVADTTTISAADGVADNTQVLVVENLEATDGRSYGLKIKAGSTANDAPLFIQDHDAANDLMIVRGNGAVGIGTTSPSNLLHTSGAGAQRIQVDATDNNAAGAGLYMKVLNSDSLVGNATIRVDNAGNIDFFNGTSSESQKMTILADGKVGIGTTAPDTPLHVVGNNGLLVDVDGNGDGQVYFGHISGSDRSYVARSSDDFLLWNVANGHLRFGTNNSERVRITSAGNIGFGLTAPTFSTGNGMHFADAFAAGFGTGNGTRPDFQISGGNDGLAIACGTGADTADVLISTSGQIGIGQTSPGYLLDIGTTTTTGIRVANLSANGIGYHAQGSGNHNFQPAKFFFHDDTLIGSIACTSNATAYNTSSDYRLKENVDYTWDATTRLKQLKPARFNFISDDTNTLVDGFIAHEVSSIVPEAITGVKDAMTAEVLYVEDDVLPEGKSIGDVKTASAPDYQGIDQSKLVPLLVKTIQELEARITTLEG